MEIVEAYLDIERARFEHRLRVRLEVDPALSHIRVPPLLLQPLVENAVKHGIAPEKTGGEVGVKARLGESMGDPVLILTVHDTGAGVSAAELACSRAVGIGLSNVERRLACQYGELATLTFSSVPGHGTTVEVRLPVNFPTVAAVGRPSLPR